MIIDATPHVRVKGDGGWWSARSPRLSLSCRISIPPTTPSRPTEPVGVAERGLALFRAGRLTEALPLIGRAALAGDPRAQYILATALFNGDGVPRDWPTAVELMRRARDGGVEAAAASLAVMAELVPSEEAAQSAATPLLSDEATAAVAIAFASVAPREAQRLEPALGSLESLARDLLAPLLRVRLERLIPEAAARAASRHTQA